MSTDTSTETDSPLAGAVATLAADVWEWRARQQPASGDDIPRLPRPPGWLPDNSAAAVERDRATRDAFAARAGTPSTSARSTWPPRSTIA